MTIISWNETNSSIFAAKKDSCIFAFMLDSRMIKEIRTFDF